MIIIDDENADAVTCVFCNDSVDAAKQVLDSSRYTGKEKLLNQRCIYPLKYLL